MAYRVVWSAKALEDVDAIATYIARDSDYYAAAVVKKILDMTANLSNSPLSGKPLTEFDQDNIKELVAYTYRIIYRIDSKTVTIAAIIHKISLLEKLELK